MATGWRGDSLYCHLEEESAKLNGMWLSGERWMAGRPEPGKAVKRCYYQTEGKFRLGQAEVRVYEQYSRDDFPRHLFVLPWSSEDRRRMGGRPNSTWYRACEHSVDCGWWLSCHHQCIQDTQFFVHNKNTQEGCGNWLIHSLAQHTRVIHLQTTFFYSLVHLLLVKYKSLFRRENVLLVAYWIFYYLIQERDTVSYMWVTSRSCINSDSNQNPCILTASKNITFPKDKGIIF